MPNCLPQLACQFVWRFLHPNAVRLVLASILSNFVLLSPSARRPQIWAGRLSQILIQAHFRCPTLPAAAMWRSCHIATAWLNAHVAILQQNGPTRSAHTSSGGHAPRSRADRIFFDAPLDSSHLGHTGHSNVRQFVRRTRDELGLGSS